MKDSMIVPLYQQVKEDIKVAIERGDYKTNEKIPSEPELSTKYSVSRITVRRAVEELCSEGYLTKMQGRGTFVSAPRIHRKVTGSNRMESFSKTCQNYGMTAGARVLNQQIVPVQQDEQEFLAMETDGLLLYIERLRTADGLPIFLENLFLLYQEYRSLLEQDLNDVSIFAEIERLFGKRPADTSRRTLEVTKASASQAQKLGVSLGEPLIFMNCYFIDAKKQPLFIGRQYYVGSRYMFEL